MDIYKRFLSLPRARKGATTVVIVEESVLSELIGDAQASEGDLVRRTFLPPLFKTIPDDVQPARRQSATMQTFIPDVPSQGGIPADAPPAFPDRAAGDDRFRDAGDRVGRRTNRSSSW